MISFDFDYYKPISIQEAIETYKGLTGEGKVTIYYAGGTEIINLARTNQLLFEAVIDLKEIPECNLFEIQHQKLIIGAAVTLTKISDSLMFPFLATSCRGSADRTARDKITLGGNICGKTQFKEGILPLLLANSEIVIVKEEGLKTVPLKQIFNQELQLNQGEFVTHLIVDQSYIGLPYAYIKKTKQEKVDYPLVAVAAIEKDKRLSIAFSGLCPYPFWSAPMDEVLNNKEISFDKKIDDAFSHLPAPILSDLRGSAEYRNFVLRNILHDILTKFGGMD